jgi:hypothetical protein
MFPLSESLGFWAFTAALCAAVYFLMRRHVRKQIATAPTASLRSPSQRALHWTSLLLLVVPLGYVFLVEGQFFWAAFAILWAQAGAMLLFRLLGVRHAVRLWLLIPIAVGSIAVGAVAGAWPSVELSTIQAAQWVFLSLSALAFALSSALSLCSFPIGYGERAR